jgi:hypothetical protein
MLFIMCKIIYQMIMKVVDEDFESREQIRFRDYWNWVESRFICLLTSSSADQSDNNGEDKEELT